MGEAKVVELTVVVAMAQGSGEGAAQAEVAMARVDVVMAAAVAAAKVRPARGNLEVTMVPVVRDKVAAGRGVGEQVVA